MFLNDIFSEGACSKISNSDIPFWPRGFPLNLVNVDESNIKLSDITKISTKNIGFWQCMVDGDPDIDAIHRLIFKRTPKFKNLRSILMGTNIFFACL